jgi:hypothetical protein
VCTTAAQHKLKTLAATTLPPYTLYATIQIHVVSASALTLPLLVEDASRPVTEGEEEGSVQETSTSTSEADGASTGAHVGPRVSASTALDYRWIDLRTPANQVRTRGATTCSHVMLVFVMSDVNSSYMCCL